MTRVKIVCAHCKTPLGEHEDKYVTIKKLAAYCVKCGRFLHYDGTFGSDDILLLLPEEGE